MAKLFREVTPTTLAQIPFTSWWREAWTRLNTSTHDLLLFGDKWDLRFWLKLLLRAPLLYLALPLLVLYVRRVEHARVAENGWLVLSDRHSIALVKVLHEPPHNRPEASY